MAWRLSTYGAHVSGLPILSIPCLRHVGRVSCQQNIFRFFYFFFIFSLSFSLSISKCDGYVGAVGGRARALVIVAPVVVALAAAVGVGILGTAEEVVVLADDQMMPMSSLSLSIRMVRSSALRARWIGHRQPTRRQREEEEARMAQW